MKLTKSQLSVLKELFQADIDHAVGERASHIVQTTKSTVTASLAAKNLIAEAQAMLPGRFPALIKGWELTEKGRITFCEQCEDHPDESVDATKPSTPAGGEKWEEFRKEAYDGYMRDAFVKAFQVVAGQAHATATSKGWWAGRLALEEAATTVGGPVLHTVARSANDAALIALIQSEASEALEAMRAGNPPDDKIPEFSGAEAELADVVIRIMDMSAARGWDVGAAIKAKMEMNLTRSHMHGGKKF